MALICRRSISPSLLFVRQNAMLRRFGWVRNEADVPSSVNAQCCITSSEEPASEIDSENNRVHKVSLGPLQDTPAFHPFVPAPHPRPSPRPLLGPLECFASSHLLSTGLLSNDAKQQFAINVLDHICHHIIAVAPSRDCRLSLSPEEQAVLRANSCVSSHTALTTLPPARTVRYLARNWIIHESPSRSDRIATVKSLASAATKTLSSPSYPGERHLACRLYWIPRLSHRPKPQSPRRARATHASLVRKRRRQGQSRPETRKQHIVFV